jgi:hypothetical protein
VDASLGGEVLKLPCATLPSNQLGEGGAVGESEALAALGGRGLRVPGLPEGEGQQDMELRGVGLEAHGSAQVLRGLLGLGLVEENAGHGHRVAGIAGVPPGRLLQLGQRSSRLAGVPIALTEAGVEPRVLGRQADGLLDLRQRSGRKPEPAVREAEVVMA